MRSLAIELWGYEHEYLTAKPSQRKKIMILNWKLTQCNEWNPKQWKKIRCSSTAAPVGDSLEMGNDDGSVLKATGYNQHSIHSANSATTTIGRSCTKYFKFFY